MALGNETPRTLLTASRAALLLLDVQNRYFWTAEGGDALPSVAILPCLARLTAAARQSGRPCVFAHVPGDRSAESPSWSRRRAFLSRQMAARLDESAWGRSFVESVAPRDGDLVLSKPRLSAFCGTWLDHHLRSRSVETVVLAGVATNGAIIATALDAVSRDLHSLVVTDASAGTTTVHHQAALTVMGDENLITTSEVCDVWLGGSDA